MAALELTPKQEKFCQCIASGMSGIESYKAAYNTHAKENTIYNESKKLLMRDDITDRITQLRKPIENHIKNAAISARNKQIQEIQERIRICKEKEDENSLIRYYDMLNKIYCLYKDTDIGNKNESPLKTMDDETLKKLSKAL